MFKSFIFAGMEISSVEIVFSESISPFTLRNQVNFKENGHEEMRALPLFVGKFKSFLRGHSKLLWQGWHVLFPKH